MLPRPFSCVFLLMVALSEAAVSATPAKFDAVALLDPERPEAARATQLQILKAAADRGEHAARCLLGRLGLQRQLAPGAAESGAYGDIGAYLNACLLGGDLNSMLVLAEAELHADKPLEAMIWVQAYLQLAKVFGSEVVNSASPYKAGLIARIERGYHGRRPENEEVQEYVAGLLAKFGERIVEQARAGGGEWTAAILPPQPNAELARVSRGSVLVGRFTREISDARDELSFATVLLAVDESGRVAETLTIEGYPELRSVRKLIKTTSAERFNNVPAGTGLRHTTMQLYVDNHAYDLMPDAPADRRPAN